MDVHQKKQKNVTDLEYLEGHFGDAWIWVAFDPVNKVIVAFIVGKRKLEEARELLHVVHERSGDDPPCFTSDELDHYSSAILDVYGIEKIFEKTGKRGRPKKSIKEIPPSLIYMQVKKTREKGRVIQIEKNIVFGTEEAAMRHVKESPVSTTVNTSFIERNHLTLRQGNGRLERKSLKFSKKKALLQAHLDFFLGYYHFIRPHGGLKKRFDVMTTPMMAAGKTNHPWTLEELFLFKMPLKKRGKS